MILNGLKDLSKYSIIHRDLKPSNLLLSFYGILKIGDFGLSRIYLDQPAPSAQIATRWYRSPESLFGSRYYDMYGDIWAAGCIFAELCNKSPLFGGDNDIDQLFQIFRQLGTNDLEIKWPEAQSLPDFSKISYPSLPSVPLSNTLSDAPKELIEIIEKFLIYRPEDRDTASNVIMNDWFYSEPLPASTEEISNLIQQCNKKVPKSQIDWEWKGISTINEPIKRIIKRHHI